MTEPMGCSNQKPAGLKSFKEELLEQLPNLRAFAMTLVRNSAYADDLVQDTLMKAWSKQSSFEAGSNMRAWLFTILRNEFYSQMRKSGRVVEDAEGYFTDQMAVPPSQDGTMDMRDFKVALAKLPDDQREAIILVGASGFSYDEAAEICGTAVGTIKSRVSRARVRLQELLNVNGAEDYGPDASSASTLNKSFAS